MCVGWNGRPICSIQYLVVMRNGTPASKALWMTESGSPLARKSRRRFGRRLLIIWNTSRQNASCSLVLQTGFVVHAELDGVHAGTSFTSLARAALV